MAALTNYDLAETLWILFVRLRNPVMMGRSVKQRKNVLLLVETSRAFGRGILHGISRYVFENDNWSIHVEDRGLLECAPSWLKNWKGNGIISRTASLAVARAIQHLSVPTVELYGNNKEVISEIRIDEDQITRSVVDHFTSAGLKNVAFFAVGNTCWTQFRIEALHREVDRRGNVYVFSAAGKGPRVFYPTWYAKFDKMMLRWLTHLPKPIGIWTLNDALAVRLLEGCRRTGLSVPDEVAICGTLNDPVLCNITTPALSSVDLNSFQMGYAAAHRLANKMNGIVPSNDLVLIPPLGVVARQSTDIIAIPDEVVVAAIRFIRENATTYCPVDNIADFVDVSRSNLQRRFQKYVGRTIEKEIMRVRMDHAKCLLRESRLTLSAIASKVGFASSDYFIQAFRRETGVTPNRYRKQVQFVPDDDVR